MYQLRQLGDVGRDSPRSVWLIQLHRERWHGLVYAMATVPRL